ncbi:MAG TPA: response regulator [Acidimicrobiales bacterium]|nr:response regulator [Acidimicrobiales bacterium]
MPESGLPTAATPRVLLVDDRSERREVMRVVLETGDPAGMVVGQADSPATALAAADRYDPDVVVLDVQMPVGAGLAAIAGLRAAHPSLVIVVCTFHGDPSTRRQALVAGANVYLGKPVSARELRTACRTSVLEAPRDLTPVR